MKYCIIICGPTAIGKTALAIELASHFFTEIISADSRQCYKGLDIGVAKPTGEQLNNVQHYFINSHSIFDQVTAAGFEQYAMAAAEKIFLKNNVAIMVGGTGLYIRAFTHGMDEIPPINNETRKKILALYSDKGINWLLNEIKIQDPVYYLSGEINNPQRSLRALEVKLSTGKSILDFQSGIIKNRNFQCIKIGLQMNRPLLYSRINNRVDEMIKQGLEDEARALYAYKNLNALQTVGYQEFFEYFDGKISKNRAVELIKQHTRNYAKRQITWFKKEPQIQFCNPSAQEIIALLQEQIKY